MQCDMVSLVRYNVADKINVHPYTHVNYFCIIFLYEIITGPRFVAGGHRAREAPPPRTEVQQTFHHTRSVKV